MRRAATAFVFFALLCGAGAGAAQDPRAIPLVDQSGAPFTLDDLHGRPVVVTFVASRCSDACPIANAMFFNLEQRFARQGTSAVLVTVTLDPEYDSPFVMSRLARQLQADPARWRFAGGGLVEVHALMRAFGITAERDRHGIPEVHSSFVYVLDSHGRLSRTLLLSTNLVDEATRALSAR